MERKCMTDFTLRGDNRKIITHINKIEGLPENFGFHVSTFIDRGVISTNFVLVRFENTSMHRMFNWYSSENGQQYTGRMTTSRMKTYHSSRIDNFIARELQRAIKQFSTM